MQEGGSQAIGGYFMCSSPLSYLHHLQQIISATWSELASAPASRKGKRGRAGASPSLTCVDP